nr:2-oxoisovalerate dehydrogenase [Gammaproteobacteria bacterium]
MSALHLIVEEAPEARFTAHAVGAGIFTEADHLQTQHARVRDAVRCHFDAGHFLGLIHLHIARKALLQRLLD